MLLLTMALLSLQRNCQGTASTMPAGLLWSCRSMSTSWNSQALMSGPSLQHCKLLVCCYRDWPLRSCGTLASGIFTSRPSQSALHVSKVSSLQQSHSFCSTSARPSRPEPLSYLLVLSTCVALASCPPNKNSYLQLAIAQSLKLAVLSFFCQAKSLEALLLHGLGHALDQLAFTNSTAQVSSHGAPRRDRF